jgi:hypothetical protein
VVLTLLRLFSCSLNVHAFVANALTFLPFCTLLCSLLLALLATLFLSLLLRTRALVQRVEVYLAKNVESSVVRRSSLFFLFLFFLRLFDRLLAFSALYYLFYYFFFCRLFNNRSSSFTLLSVLSGFWRRSRCGCRLFRFRVEVYFSKRLILLAYFDVNDLFLFRSMLFAFRLLLLGFLQEQVGSLVVHLLVLAELTLQGFVLLVAEFETQVSTNLAKLRLLLQILHCCLETDVQFSDCFT